VRAAKRPASAARPAARDCVEVIEMPDGSTKLNCFN
jgi:hypothetical protein